MKKIIGSAVRLLAGVILLSSSGILVKAAGGDLDPSFDPGTGADNRVWSTAVQADGKIIIGGWFTSYNGVSRNGVARLNPDGSLDTSFNPGTGANGLVYKVVVQADGKIIIGGNFTSYNGTGRGCVARLNADGSLDTTFDPAGGADTEVLAMILQADGKVIIGGNFTSYGGTPRSRIARLNLDGSLDTSFNPGTGADDRVWAAASQPDGKIIIGGNFTSYNATPRSCVARINPDGSLDATFDPGTGADISVFDIVVDPGGKVFIGGGFTSYNGVSRNGIARLNADGSLDPIFNPGTGTNGSVSAIALQARGKILIGGFFTSYGGSTCNHLARINPTGALDATFSQTGSGLNERVRAITAQRDGKIIIGGDFTGYDGVTRNRLARLLTAPGVVSFSAANYSASEGNAAATITLRRAGGTDNEVVAKVSLTDVTTSVADYRFTPGALNTSFVPVGGANNYVSEAALQADGRIIIVGNFTDYNGSSRNGIARLFSIGILDTTFDPGTGANGLVSSTALQSDGRIIIGGDFTSYNGTPVTRIARLNSDGSLDTTFHPGAGANGFVNKVIVQADGKIIIAGNFTSYGGATRNRLARLNADGSLDTTFNPGTGADNIVQTADLQADGRVIIAGNFTSYNGTARNHIARLNLDGSLDTTFDPGTGADGVVVALASQADGKILIGGSFTSYNGTGRNNVARLNADGSLDKTFNPGAGAAAGVLAIVLQPDGKIILGGDFGTFNNTARNHVARLNPDGSLDTAFNTSAGVNNSVKTVAVQANGRIIIGGFFTEYNGTPRNHIAGLDGDFFVTWPAGDALDKTISLPIVDDSLAEANETLTLTLTPLAGGAATGSPSQATLIIVDNETSVYSVTGRVRDESNKPVSAVLITFEMDSAGTHSIRTIQTDGNGNYSSGELGRQDSVKVSASKTGLFFQPASITFINPSAGSSGTADFTALTSLPLPMVLFSQPFYTVKESEGSVTVTVIRQSASSAATVDYATTDSAGLSACSEANTGKASSRCDYATTVGTLRFDVGETSKTISIPIVDDGYVEGLEGFTVLLKNPQGASLGSNSTTEVFISDNDTTATNPIVGVPFFVRQQYIDFLGREPDPGGFAAWQNILNSCAPGDTSCDRVSVSAGFFRSPEFQARGYFIYKFYSAALGRKPAYDEFMPDLARVSGFLTDAQLEANKVAFVQEFMTRTEYANRYGSLANAAFVDTLVQTAGLQSHPLRDAWVGLLNNGSATKAEVLRAFTESLEVYNKFYNEAFVVMQYFGYLRRDPDASYLQWIQTMNANGGDYRAMIAGFINSNEYVLRFGP